MCQGSCICVRGHVLGLLILPLFLQLDLKIVLTVWYFFVFSSYFMTLW